MYAVVCVFTYIRHGPQSWSAGYLDTSDMLELTGEYVNGCPSGVSRHQGGGQEDGDEPTTKNTQSKLWGETKKD